MILPNAFSLSFQNHSLEVTFEKEWGFSQEEQGPEKSTQWPPGDQSRASNQIQRIDLTGERGAEAFFNWTSSFFGPEREKCGKAKYKGAQYARA